MEACLFKSALIKPERCEVWQSVILLGLWCWFDVWNGAECVTSSAPALFSDFIGIVNQDRCNKIRWQILLQVYIYHVYTRTPSWEYNNNIKCTVNFFSDQSFSSATLACFILFHDIKQNKAPLSSKQKSLLLFQWKRFYDRTLSDEYFHAALAYKACSMLQTNKHTHTHTHAQIPKQKMMPTPRGSHHCCVKSVEVIRMILWIQTVPDEVLMTRGCGRTRD